MSWNVLDAFIWPFLVFTKSITLGRNRINHWHDNWIIFAETSFSNTLSTAKFVWKFPLMPEKSYFQVKKIWTSFLSLSWVQTSVGVLFGNRKRLERIRTLRNVTFYDFRQVPLEPVKNAMLSPVKRFDWLFYSNYVFYQSQFKTDNCFLAVFYNKITIQI